VRSRNWVSLSGLLSEFMASWPICEHPGYVERRTAPPCHPREGGDPAPDFVEVSAKRRFSGLGSRLRGNGDAYQVSMRRQYFPHPHRSCDATSPRGRGMRVTPGSLAPLKQRMYAFSSHRQYRRFHRANHRAHWAILLGASRHNQTHRSRCTRV
jgi:hypothetical protein